MSLGLSVNWAWVEGGGSDPLEGIVVEDLENGETTYQPRPVMAWPVPDIFLSAFMVRSGTETRKLILGVVLKGVDEDVLGPLILSIDGSSTTLKLREHPRIDTSGCVPTATQTIKDEDDLVRRISSATMVRVGYETRGAHLKATLTPEDLERFRRIIALHDMDVLPQAPPGAGNRAQGETLFGSPPEGVSNPEIIPSSKIKPRYPRRARMKGKSGRIVLKAQILEDGTIGRLLPVNTSAGGCGFEEAAMKAVRQWRYKPAMKNGEPIEVDFTIVVDFVLAKASGSRVAHLETAVAGRAARGL